MSPTLLYSNTISILCLIQLLITFVRFLYTYTHILPHDPWESEINLNGKPTKTPSLSIIIPSRDEPLETIKMTIESAISVDYPENKVKIILTDNSSENSRYRLTANYFNGLHKIHNNIHFIHRNTTIGFKAGNLDFALEQFKSDYVLFLDIDNTCGSYRKKIMKYIQYLERNQSCAYIQFKNQPRNSKQNYVSQIFSSSMRIYKAAEEARSNTNNGFAYFQGHSCLWRDSSIRMITPLANRFANKMIVAEDLHAAVRIHIQGMTGKQSDEYGTFYAPITITSAEKMLTRWIYGKQQVIFKTFRELLCLLKRLKTRMVTLNSLSRAYLDVSNAILPYLVFIDYSISDSMTSLYSATTLMIDAVFFNVILSAALSDRNIFEQRVRQFLLSSWSLVCFNAVEWCSQVKAVFTFFLQLDYNWVPTQKIIKTQSKRSTAAPSKKQVLTTYFINLIYTKREIYFSKLLPLFNMILIVYISMTLGRLDVIIAAAPLIYYSFVLITFAMLEERSREKNVIEENN